MNLKAYRGIFSEPGSAIERAKAGVKSGVIFPGQWFHDSRYGYSIRLGWRSGDYWIVEARDGQDYWLESE